MYRKNLFLTSKVDSCKILVKLIFSIFILPPPPIKKLNNTKFLLWYGQSDLSRRREFNVAKLPVDHAVYRANDRLGDRHRYELEGSARQLGRGHRARLAARHKLDLDGQLVARDDLGQREHSLVIKIGRVVLVLLDLHGELDVELDGQQVLDGACAVHEQKAVAFVACALYRVALHLSGDEFRVALDHHAFPLGVAVVARAAVQLVEGRLDQKVDLARQVKAVYFRGALKVPVLLLNGRRLRAYATLGAIPVGYEIGVGVARRGALSGRQDKIAVVHGLHEQVVVLFEVRDRGARDPSYLGHLERLDELEEGHGLVGPLEFGQVGVDVEGGMRYGRWRLLVLMRGLTLVLCGLIGWLFGWIHLGGRERDDG